MTTLEHSEYEALKQVVDYCFDDEQKNFEEGLTIDEWHLVNEGNVIQTDHIFCSLQLLKDFIKRTEDEGPRED